MRNEAIGLSVEGTDVRVAHLGLSRKGVILKRLEVTQLPAPLGLAEDELIETDTMSAFDDAFGDVGAIGSEARPKDDGEPVVDEEIDASSALFNILSEYNMTKSKLALNLQEDTVHFYLFDDNFKVSGPKLKKALVDMVSPNHEVPLSPDMLECIRTQEKKLVCIVSEQQPSALRVIRDLKPFMGNNKPYVGLVDSMETALMSLARANHELAEGEITAIVHIGQDTTRVVVMKGRDYMRLLPPVQEGIRSPDVVKTIFSKILFEQDEGGLPELDRVILAGEAEAAGATDFFTEKMPSAKVEIIKSGKYCGSEMSPSSIPAPLSSFALPLALARKALEPNNPDYYQTDFTPDQLKESQKPFRIAWHGLITLAIIFSVSLFLIFKGSSNYSRMGDLQNSIDYFREYTELAEPLLREVDMLTNQVTLYQTQIAQHAMLSMGSDTWNRSLEKIGDLAERHDSLWLTNLRSAGCNGMVLTGKSRSRRNISLLTSSYREAYLDNVSRGMVRDYPVWDFSLRVRFPDLLEEPVYVAMAQARGNVDFESGAPIGASEVQMPSMGNLAMFPQMSPSLTGSQQAPGMGGAAFAMQGPATFDGVLKAGFNAYYERAEVFAASQEWKELEAEQKIAEAAKTEEEKYLESSMGLKADVPVVEPQPESEPEVELEVLEDEFDDDEIPFEREQSHNAGPLPDVVQQSPPQSSSSENASAPAAMGELGPAGDELLVDADDASSEGNMAAAPEEADDSAAERESSQEASENVASNQTSSSGSASPEGASALANEGDQARQTKNPGEMLGSERKSPRKVRSAEAAYAANAAGLERALELFNTGEYEKAAGLFEKLLSNDADASTACKAHYWLGHCHYGTGELHKAIAEFESASTCGGSDIEDGALFMLGNCYLRLGNKAKANHKYAKLLEEFPQSRFCSAASARAESLGR